MTDFSPKITFKNGPGISDRLLGFYLALKQTSFTCSVARHGLCAVLVTLLHFHRHHYYSVVNAERSPDFIFAHEPLNVLVT